MLLKQQKMLNQIAALVKMNIDLFDTICFENFSENFVYFYFIVRFRLTFCHCSILSNLAQKFRFDSLKILLFFKLFQNRITLDNKIKLCHGNFYYHII